LWENIGFCEKRGGVMVQRYISAEQSIAAAGAAFACVDDDFSDISRARTAADNARRHFYFHAMVDRFWKFIGFK
jgi:hypothetical protein